MPRSRKVAIGASAIAASLLAFLIAPEATLWLRADHRTTGSVAEYALPDGSTAWLDVGSAISVDFTERERKVTLLRGNAWFDVRHGAEPPFRVAALNGMTQDIGTSFEVRRQSSRVDIAVSQGAVRVASDAERSKSIVLREGEGVAYDASGKLLRQSSRAPASIAAWRREELIIDRQPLAAAIREIGRYRSGPTWVWVDLSDRAPVNGAFRIDDADTALRDLAAVQGLTLTWLPGDIAIIRRGNPAR
jgi:transmembrane sensor